MFEWLKDKLVDDVHEWYKWFSTWFFVSIPTLIALQENIAFMQDMVPDWLIAVLAILGLIARIVKQNKEDKNDNAD